MTKVVVVNHVTLDGVMQAPARPEEDTRDGFSHGGWAIPNGDEVMSSKMGERMAAGSAQSGALLLGRRTYEASTASGPSRAETLTPRCSTTVPSTWRLAR
jgi:dihydrofolate reductase